MKPYVFDGQSIWISQSRVLICNIYTPLAQLGAILSQSVVVNCLSCNFQLSQLKTELIANLFGLNLRATKLS